MITITNQVTLKNYMLGHYYRLGFFLVSFLFFLMCGGVYIIAFGSFIDKISGIFLFIVALMYLVLPIVKYLLAKYLHNMAEIIFQFDGDLFITTYGKTSVKTNKSEFKKILFHKKYLLIIGKLGQQPVLFEDVDADDIKNQLMNSDFKDLMKFV